MKVWQLILLILLCLIVGGVAGIVLRVLQPPAAKSAPDDGPTVNGYEIADGYFIHPIE